MADNVTEEEQVEALKKWFDENGTSLIVSIVVVLAVVFGYRTWETQGKETAEAASAIYEDLQDAVAIGPLETLSDDRLSTGQFLAKQLKTEYSDSTYAYFAAMQLAKLDVTKGDLVAAGQELQWALDNGIDEKLGIIVNLRLAKVKLGLGEHDAALAQLDKYTPGAHESSYEELRGDIFYAMDKKHEAREAYQRAVNLQGETIKPFTQMKLEDLVVVSSVIVAAPVAAIAETSEPEKDQ